ncbi:MAG: hypothetical protein LBU73_00095 [Helicobacteraceae bacterium]|jgi:uncharacterized membrane protein|nr:hypothetical protein [Helicobacteraceae bacterium]
MQQMQIPMSKGTLSLVLAGVGFALCFSPLGALGLILAIAGFVLGIITLKEAKQAGDKQEENIALAATIIGGIAIVLAGLSTISTILFLSKF